MSKQLGTWSTATVLAVGNVDKTIQVQRDGQDGASYAIAQYSGAAVGDRVTLLLIGQRLYATGVLV